eukprot:g16804.t1
MADGEGLGALKGLEKQLFKLMAKEAPAGQWAEWLRAPLEHALAGGHKKLALALLNTDADAGAGWKGCHGRTLLGAAAEGGNQELLLAVLKAGGLEEINAVDDANMTALHHAVVGGHTELARELMVAGADAALLDNRDRSALHYAVEGGHTKLAECAIVAGADVTWRDADGNSPLHLAAERDDEAFVGKLLRRGADVSAANERGYRPLHVAVECDRLTVAEALLEAGADPHVLCNGNSVLHMTVWGWNLAMTKLVLSYGVDVEQAGRLVFTPLHGAAAFGLQLAVEALVDAGANVEARLSDSYTDPTLGKVAAAATALHFAAHYCRNDTTSLLLRKGADPGAVDANGQTPLHLLCRAAMRRHPRCPPEELTATIADLLLRAGADENVTDNDGRTPDQLLVPGGATERLQEVLANAPADRAWRRRGMLVMWRAFPDKIKVKGGRGRAGKAKGRRGRGGGSADEQGIAVLLSRVVEMENADIFKQIVVFL